MTKVQIASDKNWYQIKADFILLLIESNKWKLVREAAKKSFFSGPTTKRGGGLGPDH